MEEQTLTEILECLIFIFCIYGILWFCLQLKAAQSTWAARVIPPMCPSYLHCPQLSAAPGVRAAPSSGFAMEIQEKFAFYRDFFFFQIIFYTSSLVRLFSKLLPGGTPSLLCFPSKDRHDLAHLTQGGVAAAATRS